MKTNEIRHYKGFTDEDELWIGRVVRELEEGGLPKQTTKTLKRALDKELKSNIHPLRVLAILRRHIPAEFLTDNGTPTVARIFGPREVILSEYLLSG